MRRADAESRLACLAIAACLVHAAAIAQPGPDGEPIRYAGGIQVDPEVHEGRLRPAIGVASYQVLRANRTHPELADSDGWTYNHAPMLAYWRGKFYLEYLSNPVGEHEPPGRTLLVTSADGRSWSQPVVVFPPYQPPKDTGAPAPAKSTGYMMHQRMGFFVAPNGRLLACAFYGHAPNPFRTGGIGRVVREVYGDGRLGPIHFIRYNSSTPWNEKNTAFPFYRRAADPGFVEACDALLANRLVVEQWRDEDPEVAAIRGQCSSLSFFHRAGGSVAGICKNGYTAVSMDEGKTWSAPQRAAGLIANNAKVWGQRTKDGRYALVYNPVTFGSHRWPLAVSTSKDGVVFDTLNLVNGEVPPRRFIGRAKDFGTQYIRGIVEGNGDPGDGAIWVTYSGNKEDIWVSRIPTPIRERVDGPVHDTFDGLQTNREPPEWNIYSPKWAKVGVAAFPGASDRSLELRDKDPYDYARAVRVFAESKAASVSLRIMPKAAGAGGLEIEISDRHGNRPVRVAFTADGRIQAVNGASATDLRKYEPGKWLRLRLDVNVEKAQYSLSVDGAEALRDAAFAEKASSVERLSLRTGPHRNEPTRRLDRYDPSLKDLPGADEPVKEAIFYIDEVSVK